MGGARQFTALLRKNLLLKTRRPCATCFEMALPLVLFMGLVYVREKVDDDSFGPFTFEHNEIYPMSSTVARSLLNVFDSSVDDLNASLRSSGKYGDTGAMIQKTSDADKAMETMRQELGSMIGGVICNNHNGTVSESIANHMEPMLAMKYDGKTLAHHMLHVNASHDGEWVRSMVEEVQAWNMSKVVAELDAARHHYLNWGWPRMIEDAAKRVDEELDKLNALLDHPKGSHGTHLMVGHWVDSACSLHLNNATVLANMSAAWNALNASHLAKEMASMREVLKKAGIVDMFNSTSTSSLSKSMSSMMNSMMKMMNNLASTENSDEVSKMMQSMFGSLQTTSAHELAEFADTAAWWISHFVRTRGLVARLLGEQPSNAWDMDWASMTSSNAGMSAFSGMRTDMADTLFQSLRHFQNGTNAANTTQDMQKAWKSMSTSMSSMMNSMSLTMQNESTSIMKKLEGHIQEMMHYNLSGMEHVMLPKWSSDWQTSCPQHLNKSYISNKVDSMRMRCPFYRRQVRHLATVNLSQEVAYFHKHLAQWNSQRTWRCPIFRAQHELRVNGNATKLGESVRHTITDLQHKLHHDKGKGEHKGIVEARQAQGTAQVKQYASILGNSVQGMLHDHLGVKNTQCEAGRKLAERMNFFDQIMNQKILVAPYKGEARELMHYMFVELAQSLTITNENSRLADMPKPLEALLRCPLVKAALAVGIDLFMKDRMVTFGTEAELEDYARRNPKKVLMALVFHNADPATGNFPTGTLTVDYAIRAHAQYLPQTSKILRLARNAIFGAVRMSFYYYIDLYFAHIQEAMGRSVARLRANRELVGPGSNYSTIGRNIGASARTEKARQLGMALQQFPAPEYTVDKFIRAIQHTMPMFMMLGWIYAVSLLVKEMVYEKQEKLRDVMRIQGLKTWVYWSSWMASAMIQWMFLVTAIVCILSGGGVLRHSNPLIIFIFFSSYSLATVSFSMLISAFFSRAKVAAACAGLLYYGSYMPYSFFNRFEDVLTLNAKNAFCLLSSTGMGIGSGLLAKWELLEIGVQWSNLFQAPPITYSGAEPKDNFSLGSVMLMFYIDTIVYQVLAWYVQKVRPGTLGLPQPWYFPFLRSYWLGARDVPDMLDASSDDAEEKDNAKLECWEGPSSDLEVVVKMRGLTKTFSRGKKALKGISLDMHRGTILGLLGHNGAGKSTTMSILTGLYPPTAGDVVVNGRSVQKDSQGVRQQLGVCLQHNALYEWITVEEHLSLFCCLKSVPWQEMKSTVQGLLQDTGLMNKRHTPSKALSGGMKRKLSIGIALSGGSKVITLDEPTAGIDANSRREIWQLLARQKAQRTILLSTHFMDEADILSDRIAIIAEGELTAIGTGMTLKKHFADKYMLTLVTADVVNPARLSSLICTAVPDAEFAGSRGRELSYLLPGGARGHFAGLFKQLQDPEARAAVGIETYGLSAATMEEVFLQASSVHEDGLSGMVRNIGPSEATVETPIVERQVSADDVSTSSGTGSNDLSDKGLARSNSDNSGSDVPNEREDERPISPQSMVSDMQEPIDIDNGILPDSAKPENTTLEAQVKKIMQSDKHFDEKSDSDLKIKAIKVEVAETNSEASVTKTPVALWHGYKLWGLQFGGLMRKRALSVRRDRKSWASQLLLPALFVFLALVIAKALTVKEEEPPLKLNTDMFIGTTSAGAVTKSLAKHTMPFGTMRNDDFSATMLTSFQNAKGDGDVFSEVEQRGAPDLTNYLMDNHQAMLTKTYGAVGLGGSTDFPNVTMWFKNSAYHAVPVFTDLFNDARFKMLGFDDTNIITWSHPLPKSQVLLEDEMTGRNQVLIDLSVAITMLLAMGFIPASFVVYLVHEKSTNGKHQQLLTGISPTMYWISSYCWDILNYLLPLIVCFLIFVVFQVEAYSGRNSFAILMLLLFYGISMTPLMYCLEPFFSVPSTAYVTLICINIFTGTVSVMATAVLDMVQREEPELASVNQFLKAVFPWLLPNYSLGRGLIDIASNHYMNYAYDEFGVCLHRDGSCIRDPMNWDVIGKYLTYLMVMTPVWLSLRMFIEWGCCTRQLRKSMAVQQGMQSEKSADEAVNKEAERISAEVGASSTKDNLVISNLAKSFARQRPGLFKKRAPATHAVRGLNVGVPGGECFGLLGVNGAGKTTTMRMITGDTEIGGGDIQVCGWSVQNQRDRARRRLGYCPQFDALPDKLNVTETLALYARIRGIPQPNVKTTVKELVQKMCLEAHQNTLCEHLSGGNRRKLSTALALIGEPDVILLDEPSTGVDVGARRFLWDIIGDIRQRGTALVLTSHSMEECEVLCTRLTIMVNGQLRCLGTPTELKSKYGGGYTLMVKAILSKDTDNCKTIRDFVAERLPEASLTEESVGLLRYGLGSRGSDGAADGEVPLGNIFETFEHATKEGGELYGCVSDYTLSQTSLEEVFLHFSSDAIHPDTIPEAPEHLS